jgi:hypothetical protein
MDIKVREQDGAVMLDGDVLDGAEQAFRQTRYIEAFALLHADIDWRMIELIQCHDIDSVSSLEEEEKLFSDKEYRFKNSVRLLKKYEIIDEKECGRLLAFNELRDRVIHRLVIRSYHLGSDDPNKITKSEVTRGFEEGITLDARLANRLSVVIRSKHASSKH